MRLKAGTVLYRFCTAKMAKYDFYDFYLLVKWGFLNGRNAIHIARRKMILMKTLRLITKKVHLYRFCTVFGRIILDY